MRKGSEGIPVSELSPTFQTFESLYGQTLERGFLRWCCCLGRE